MKSSGAIRPSVAMFDTGSRIAAAAAVLCAAHCALTPLLVLVMPALGLSEGVEQTMLLGTASLGALILLVGPAREHLGVLLVFALGTGVWAASLAGWFEPVPEPATSVAGSLLLAGALLQSARICRSGSCSVCDNSEDSKTGP